MSFSDIKLYPVTKEGSVIKANGSFVYNGVCQISCTVVSGKNGLFVSLPREKYKDKSGEEKWANKVYFTDENLRKQLNDQVVGEYNRLTNSTPSDSQGRSPEPAPQTKRKSSLPF